jgi:hypothetical protein
VSEFHFCTSKFHSVLSRRGLFIRAENLLPGAFHFTLQTFQESPLKYWAY